ncbi:MAG: peptidoglycan-associated lipoprotein Pal [Pseudomonadota bacterium]
MKKLLCIGGMLALLAGCASTPTEEPKAAVEERAAPSSVAVPQRPSVPTVTPAAPKGNVPDVLKDPKNILSKRSIYFDFDKYDVKAEHRPLLQAHARYLEQHSEAKMLIQGNCDERGSREYNIALGQRRADSMKKMLMLMGVKESQIESVSLGEEKPRCTDKTEECYAQNRRGDMLYRGEY